MKCLPDWQDSDKEIGEGKALPVKEAPVGDFQGGNNGQGQEGHGHKGCLQRATMIPDQPFNGLAARGH
jgi:hypothetical protein